MYMRFCGQSHDGSSVTACPRGARLHTCTASKHARTSFSNSPLHQLADHVAVHSEPDPGTRTCKTTRARLNWTGALRPPRWDQGHATGNSRREERPGGIPGLSSIEALGSAGQGSAVRSLVILVQHPSPCPMRGHDGRSGRVWLSKRCG